MPARRPSSSSSRLARASAPPPALWLRVLRFLLGILLTLLVLAGTVSALFGLATPKQRLQVVEAIVQWQFSDVPAVRPFALAQRMPMLPDHYTMLRTEVPTPLRGLPLVLDSRSEAEYTVSHLPGALRVQTVADAQAAIATWRANHPSRRARSVAGPDVILVGTSGWHAAELARALIATGQTRVWLLQGGIFGWSQAGLPLEKDEADGTSLATPLVHPRHPLLQYLLPESARLALPGH